MIQEIVPVLVTWKMYLCDTQKSHGKSWTEIFNTLMRGMNALQRRRYKRAAPEGAATVYADARTAGRSLLTLNNTDPVEAITAIHSARCTARSWSDPAVASSTPTAAAPRHWPNVLTIDNTPEA